MYHEEKIINDKLCFRSTPKGEWREYSKEALTLMLMQKRKEYHDICCKMIG